MAAKQGSSKGEARAPLGDMQPTYPPTNDGFGGARTSRNYLCDVESGPPGLWPEAVPS